MDPATITALAAKGQENDKIAANRHRVFWENDFPSRFNAACGGWSSPGCQPPRVAAQYGMHYIVYSRSVLQCCFPKRENRTCSIFTYFCIRVNGESKNRNEKTELFNCLHLLLYISYRIIFILHNISKRLIWSVIH